MPRNARCIQPDLPFHITQRGTNRQATFYSRQDRLVYLSLLRANLQDCGVRILGYCLMTNHVHLVAVPLQADSLGIYFRRVHGRYAQYLNARRRRTGHLWQNRYFSCPLSSSHLWTALRYVETNPIRAALAPRPSEYEWSSAAAHLSGLDPSGLLDLTFWHDNGGAEQWRGLLAQAEDPTQTRLLRRCTYAGRPFGDERFLLEMEERFQRKWRRWTYESYAAAGV
jgi:putative transposase